MKIETRGRKPLPKSEVMNQRLYISTRQRKELERLIGKPFYLAVREVVDSFISANGGDNGKQE